MQHRIHSGGYFSILVDVLQQLSLLLTPISHGGEHSQPACRAAARLINGQITRQMISELLTGTWFKG